MISLNVIGAILRCEKEFHELKRAIGEEPSYVEMDSTPWISVTEDKKPNEGEVVLVYVGNGVFYCHTYSSDCGFPKVVTHWMRVLPPKE